MIGLLVTALAAVAGCSSPAAIHPKPAIHDRSRPNFVFVLTDDLSWNLVSHMPNLQALQQAGTTMSRYYVVDSLCCPSRSAIFTGQYPHDDGVFTNAGNDGGYFAFNKHGDQQKSFALALHDAGYRTALMGKYLNQYLPAYPEPPGWDEWDAAGNAYGEFDYNLNQNGQQQHYGKAPQDYLTDVLVAKARSFIDSSAASGKPFMLEVATFAPHAPYTPAPRYAHAAEQLAAPKTPAYDRLPANPPPWLKGHPPLSAADQANITSTFRKRVADDLSVDDMIGELENELRADRQRPGRPGRPGRQPADVEHRPGPDVRDPRGPARPGRRRRSQSGRAVARAGSGRLAARRPHRASRPGLLAGRPRPADLQGGRSADLRGGPHRHRALRAVRGRVPGVLRHRDRSVRAG